MDPNTELGRQAISLVEILKPLVEGEKKNEKWLPRIEWNGIDQDIFRASDGGASRVSGAFF